MSDIAWQSVLPPSSPNGENEAMRPVLVTQTFPGTLSDAERRWYDTDGWPAWVDGLDEVISVTAPWPEPGAVVTWRSGPAGRGHVTERVVAYAPGDGQSLQIADDSVTGRQSVTFALTGDGVAVSLSLEYQLKRRSLISPLVDVLFVRRAMAASLARTLHRFGARLRAGG
jgi:hypothetical protein